MNRQELFNLWLREEETAHIHGWDFSHIEGKYEEAPLPWDLRSIILEHLRPDMRILDMDTGGGEFLLSLGHPCDMTAATEAYPPNVNLCREKLIPMGVDLREAAADGPLPFADGSFDLVINRHGSFCASEIHRVLKPGGLFITQQVGADNDRELVEALYDNPPPLPYSDQRLPIIKKQFEQAGFRTLRSEEVFLPIRFFDVGALVWFARIIEWEFPGFSVEKNLGRLMDVQRLIESGHAAEGSVHRILLTAQKL